MSLTIALTDDQAALIEQASDCPCHDERCELLTALAVAVDRARKLVAVGHCPDCGHAPTGATHYRTCPTRLPADYCVGCDTDRVLGRDSGADHRCGRVDV